MCVYSNIITMRIVRLGRKYMEAKKVYLLNSVLLAVSLLGACHCSTDLLISIHINYSL